MLLIKARSKDYVWPSLGGDRAKRYFLRGRDGERASKTTSFVYVQTACMMSNLSYGTRPSTRKVNEMLSMAQSCPLRMVLSLHVAQNLLSQGRKKLGSFHSL